MRISVQKFFPNLLEEDLQELLPAKCQVDIVKLSNKVIAYSLENKILFFDPNGKGDIIVPAMHTLWEFPHIVPSLQTWSEVSPKVNKYYDLKHTREFFVSKNKGALLLVRYCQIRIVEEFLWTSKCPTCHFLRVLHIFFRILKN